MKELLGRIFRLSMPTYDETSLFVVSLAYLLVFILSDSFHFSDWKLFEDQAYVIYIIFFIGMFLSIFHAFSTRRKTTIERKIMLWYAAGSNGMSAIWAGALTLDNGFTIYSFLPILNIINGYILLCLPRAGGLDEELISNENAPLKNILWSALIVMSIFMFSDRWLQNIWPFTLAMCIVYGNNLYRPLMAEFGRRGGKDIGKRPQEWLNKAL